MPEITCITNIYLHQNAILSNKSLYLHVKKFTASYFEKQSISKVQIEALVVEIIYTYKYFGFCIFSNAAIKLLSKGLSELSGVQKEALFLWLQELSFSLLQACDFDLHYLTKNHEDLNKEFYALLVKNIFCTLENDIQQSYLVNFDNNYIEKINYLNKICLSIYSENEEIKLQETLISEMKNLDLDHLVVELFLSYFLEFVRQPLKVILWRLECFLSSKTPKDEIKIFTRSFDAQLQKKAEIFAGIIYALTPPSSSNAQQALLESPVTIKKFIFFLQRQSVHYLNFPLLKELTLLDIRVLEKELITCFEEGTELGIFYKIAKKKTGFCYGLSMAALQIISPFRNFLSEATAHHKKELLPTSSP
ncbi:MAG: hypothetical protein K2X39_01845 [Silvanigrellaceae bacterium]|nr:hypothetical protein [Silvanigrellaceae bacterium]